MNEIENKKLLELYTLAELSYEKHFNNVNRDDLYPDGWFLSKDYKTKIEIIGNAIKLNTLIVNTPSYLKIVEGVDQKTIKKELNS